MPKRVDSNQKEIVQALRKVGCSVQHLHMVGKGCPDILVGYHKTNLLVEIKDGKKSKSKQALTKDEKRWHEAWRGLVHIVNSVDEALTLVAHYVRSTENI